MGQATQFFDTDSTGSVPWDFSRYQATAVIINLVTNDLGHGVSSAQFQSAHISFLRNVRAEYPNAVIFVMETFKQCTGQGSTPICWCGQSTLSGWPLGSLPAPHSIL